MSKKLVKTKYKHKCCGDHSCLVDHTQPKSTPDQDKKSIRLFLINFIVFWAISVAAMVISYSEFV